MVLEHLPVVENWPRPGIRFLDINGALSRPECFGEIIRWMRDCCHAKGSTSVAAIESRGFVFGSPVAAMLNVPLILLRKAGRLPGETRCVKYDTEYSQDSLCVQSNAALGLRPMIVDDVLATGGTLVAAASLIRNNFPVSEISAVTVIGLSFLNGTTACQESDINLDVMEWYHG